MSDEKLTPIPMRADISWFMGNQQDKERADFEAWYAENAHNFELNPIGSRDCGLQRKAWQASAARHTARIAELEAEVRLNAEREWQPIETAPKDGTLILVSFGVKGVRAVSWADDLWCVDDDKNGPYPLRGYSFGTFTAPTHWMPLPSKPDEAMKGGA